MRSQRRLAHILGRWFDVPRPPRHRGRALSDPWYGLEPQGNDAGAYGVQVEEVDVVAGQQYWRAARVHHLEPRENGGRHHVFVDIVDEAGERVFGAQARVTSDGHEHVITVEKPEGEPGANLATWGGQVCMAEAIGLLESILPSDRVIGMHADHPDEPPGNTRFHHSFLVVFQRTTRQLPLPRASVVEGTVRHGGGREVLLLVDDQPVASKNAAEDGSYRFGGLWEATYIVAVAGTDVRSEPVALDGLTSVKVDLQLTGEREAHAKPLGEYLLFGAPEAPGTHTSILLALDYLLALQPTFGFHIEEAVAADRVLIIGDDEAVSPDTERRLLEAGCQVERVGGDSYTVQRLLAERAAARVATSPVDQAG